MIKLKRFTIIVSALCISSAAVFADLVVIDEGLDNSGLNSTVSDISGKAANFVMGAGDDYSLTSVVLGLANIQAEAVPVVELWSDEGTGTPETLLETLTNPGSLAAGANTFTSSGTTLEASKTYWVAVYASANKFDWLGNNADTSVTSDIGATHTARLYGGSSPGGWNSSSSVLNQIQVYAVPEPATMAMIGTAGLALILLRRRMNI